MLLKFEVLRAYISKYPSIGIDINDRSIIDYLFSGIPVYTSDTLMTFFPEPCFVYIGTRSIKHIKPYIFLNTGGVKKLNRQTHLIGMLRELKAIPEKYLKILDTLSEEEFSLKIKLILLGVAPIALFQSTLEDDSVYSIFSKLFTSFSDIYASYDTIHKHHKYIFSSLLSMVLKVQSLGASNTLDKLSKGYEKSLMNIKPHIPLIQQEVKAYLSSNQSELDFIKLLYSLSSDRNLLKC